MSKEKKNKINKEYALSERLIGLAELGRPVEWSKSLLNMVLAALIAYYIYNVYLDPIIFIAGFFAVAFLWSGLYALNDYTDYKIDLLHDRKKYRPIPSGKITPLQAFIFSIILILVSLLIALLLNNFLLILCLLAMITNQLLYTMKPYRLKSRKGFDILSGSMINPFFRYFSGLIIFISYSQLITQPLPILPIIFVVGIQFSGYSLYRLFSKTHDTKLKMKSTVALIPEKTIKKTAYFVMGLAILSYFGLLINGVTYKISFLGFLPPQYFLAILLVALFVLLVPSLRNAVINPKNADMKSSYRILYGMNIAFVIANLLIYIFFK